MHMILSQKTGQFHLNECFQRDNANVADYFWLADVGDGGGVFGADFFAGDDDVNGRRLSRRGFQRPRRQPRHALDDL
jgi:hypothetical protein